MELTLLQVIMTGTQLQHGREPEAEAVLVKAWDG
jgi:hypothetical protein